MLLPLRSTALGLGLVLLASFSLPAQERGTPPTFTAGTELVLVDFVVSDDADRLVKGLSAKDFVVKEDGKERPIVSFVAFAGDEPPAPVATAAPATSPAADASPAVPPAVAVRSAGAATVLLVDDAQLTQQQVSQLRPALKTLLARVGERSGTVALVAPTSKVSVAERFPSGAATLTAAVDQIVGRRFEDHSSFPVSDSEAIAVAREDTQTLGRVASRFVQLNPNLTRDQATMLAHNRGTEVAFDARTRRQILYGVARLGLDWLSRQPGRHSLVIVSGGFARDPEDSAFNEIVTRSLRVNAPIHFLDARGLQGIGLQSVQYGPGVSPAADYAPLTWSEDAEGSSGLADDTGGISVRNSNDMGKGLGRVLDMMQTYYILGYEPPANAKSGFRKINVTVRAKGLHVRARRGYLAGPPPRR